MNDSLLIITQHCGCFSCRDHELISISNAFLIKMCVQTQAKTCTIQTISPFLAQTQSRSYLMQSLI